MLRNFKHKFDMSHTKQRFTIKKLSIGVVSVLVGFTLFGFNGQSASADVASVADTTSTATDANTTADIGTSTSVPAADASANDTASTSVPAADASANDTASTPAPAADASANDTTSVSTPVADASVNDTASTSVPAADASANNTASTSVPAADASANNTASTPAPAANASVDNTTSTSSPTTANDDGLVIDGVNVIESGATNAQTQHTINGKIVSQLSGNPLEVNNTAVATPLANVRVYAQWMEKSGAMSPIYTTTSGEDGTYHVLLKDFVLPNGKLASFDADPNLPQGEKWRVWAQTPAGMQLYYSWENSQLGPQGWVMDTSYNAGNAVAVDQVNNLNFIFTPLTDNAVMHDMANVKNNQYVSGEQGWISGKVFWNNTVNFGAQTMGATDTYNGTDTPARNVTVVGSYLSDYALSKIYTDGAAALGVTNIRGTGWTDTQELQLQNWIKQQIEIEGTSKWIAETVEVPTDDNGNYTIQFDGTYGAAWNSRGYNDNALLQSNLYSNTLLPDDVALSEGLTPGVSTYSDLFNRVASSPSQGTWYKNATDKKGTNIADTPKHVNLDWTYVSLQGVDNYGMSSPYFGNKFTFDKASTSWTNTFENDTVTLQNITGADFALFPDEFLFDVVHYDTTQTFASPGDIVETNTQGLPSSDLGNNTFQIVWYGYDAKGNEVEIQASPVEIPSQTGTLSSANFTVPSDAQDGAIYTAKLYSLNSLGTRNSYPMAVDSFAVRTLTSLNDPNYTEGTVAQGGTATIPAPTFDNPTTDTTETNSAPEGTTFTTGTNNFPGTVSIDKNTGTVTVVADPAAPIGEYTIPVTVTYRDNSTDTVDVKVSVTPSDATTYDPEAQGQTVKVGEAPVAEKSIQNMDDLPAGTKVAYKDSVDTSTPGPKDATVVVTYPDGSVDEVPVQVTVLPYADSIDPEAQGQTVKVGEAPVAEKSIQNMSDLPAGTKAEYKTPVDTSTPGPKDATVVVTYPDGSVDEVPVQVTVLPYADSIDPEAQGQTVKVGEAPVAEKSIQNMDDLPAGTKVAYKDSVDTSTPGPKDATVVVTYPDGSVDEVPVQVTVLPYADSIDPEAQGQTVKVGEAPVAEKSIQNMDDLPAGTKVAYKDSVDTSTPGPKDATVVVTYPDGSVDEVPVQVTVLPYADSIDPEAQGQTVKVGEAPVAEKSIQNMSDLPAGTKAEYKTPVDTSTPGPKDATVVVTYPDGSVDEVPVQVTVLPYADSIDPEAQGQTVKVGEAPVAEKSIQNMDDLPAGTKVAYKDSVDTSTPGPKDATVVVTYPDGSVDEVPVQVTVLPYADSIDPEAQGQTVKVGEAPVAEKSIQNMSDLPAGTKAEYKTPVDTSTPGPKDATVVVTYPDGSVDEVPVQVTVLPYADSIDPEAQGQTVKVGEAPVAEKSIQNMSDLPAGTKAEYKTPVDTSTPGPKDATVVVTYPDGSVDEVPVQVTVLPYADSIDPEAQGQTVKVGEAPVAEKSIQNMDDLPAGTKVAYKDSVDTSTPGPKDATVVVTYPDGSVDEVPVQVTVLPYADSIDPEAQGQTVKVGEAPVAEKSIQNMSDLPAGTKAEYKTPVDTSTPGPKDATVVVTYPDGSVDEVPVQVTVLPYADSIDPEAQGQTVKVGEAPVAEKSIQNMSDLPAGTKAEYKTPVDTSTPGPKDATVVVTYPDGSVDEVPVQVTVLPYADSIDPEAQGQTVKVGEAPVAEKSIQNMDDLPAGTKVAYKDSVDTSTPGPKDATVVVTYPDGSVDEVPVQVTVLPYADSIDPEAQGQTVKVGEAPVAEKSIQNMSDLPAGTKAEYKTPVDTSTPGPKDATVVVTYPDGSVDEVPVQVTVLPYADSIDPEAQGQTVKVGEAPVAEKSIQNMSDLPAGTKAEYKTPVDTSTPGPKDATVVVTYPDGSVDEVPVQVTVLPYADSIDPEAQGQTVKVGEAPVAEKSIQNMDDLPAGTKVAYKDSVDTSTPGPKDATVVVTYPDGSVDEVPVQVTVLPYADSIDPEAQGQTVKVGEAPVAEKSIQNMSDLPAGTKAEYKTPVDTSTPGPKDATVVVTYPDGSVDEVPVQVTVLPYADSIDPEAQGQTVKVGEAPVAEKSIQNMSDLPAGTKAEYKTPVDTSTPGPKDATVVVTYPDGSVDEVPVQVTVLPYADSIDPEAQGQTVKVGEAPVAEKSIQNMDDLPAGTKVAYKDSVDTSTPGPKDATVVVTYPDGSVDEVPVQVTVLPYADSIDPEAQGQTVKVGEAPVAEKSIQNMSDLPAGTKAEYKTPVDTSTPGPKDATVVVTYPDGSVDEVPVQVTVLPYADSIDPEAQGQTVKVGEAPVAEKSIQNMSDLPAGTKAEYKTPVDTSTPGPKDATVVVTYPDGSVDEVPVQVTVLPYADSIDPEAQGQTVKVGEAPVAEKSIQNMDDLPAGTKVAYKDSVDTSTPGPKDATVVVTYPDGSVDEVPVQVTVLPYADSIDPEAQGQTVKVGEAPVAEKSIQNMSDLPAGTKAEYKTPVDTSTPGPKDATVVVTYPDGSVDEVPVQVTVLPYADSIDPEAQGQTVKVGEAPVAEKSIQNMSDLPAGTKAEYKTPVDTSTPGPKDATVVVTYPDGSVDEVPVQVTVLPYADSIDPEAQGQTVKVGEAPVAEKSIQNMDDLPAGTKVAYKDSVDTSTPGPKDATVVVTYPDGSVDEVPAQIIVVTKEKVSTPEPVAQDQTVKIGNEPVAADSIANKSELPEGTTYSYKEPVDTTTPGTKEATVVVTYPDGSTDEVTVKVIVEANPTQAETNEPVAQDQSLNVTDLINQNSNLRVGLTLQKDKVPDASSAVDTNHVTDLPSTGVSEKNTGSIFGILSISTFGTLLTAKFRRKKD